MGATDTVILSDYSNFIKEWYTPVIQQARKRKNVFLDDAVVKFGSEHVAGNYAYIPVEFDYMGSVGSRGENGAMPIPDAGDYQRARVALSYHFATMQLSMQLMKQSEGDRASFNPAVAQVTQTTMNSWLRHLNRMIMGDGRAILAQVDGALAGQVITIDNAFGIANDGNGDLFVSKNMRLNFFSGTTLRSAAGDATGVCTVESFTRGNGSISATITLPATDAVTGIADGDYMYLAGNKANGASTNYESQGLMLLIDDGTIATTFENISTADYPDWKAFVRYGSIPGTDEPLTRVRMNQVYKDITQKGGGEPNLIFCGTDTEETYVELCDSMSISVNPGKVDAAGLWEGPTFKGIPILSDPIYPEGRMEFIDTEALYIEESEAADWIPGDIGILQKVAGYANWVAEYAWFFNFVLKNRSKVGSLRDISRVV